MQNYGAKLRQENKNILKHATVTPRTKLNAMENTTSDQMENKTNVHVGREITVKSHCRARRGKRGCTENGGDTRAS